MVMENGPKGRGSSTGYVRVGIMLNKATGNIHIYNTQGSKKLISKVSNDPSSEHYHGPLHKHFTDFLKSGKYAK